ncbi:MAG TPA: GspMb/PilO family protein [Gemmatimonadales bacterium]|nr:GspMb/PilO family protein [Gemmatimonadales bacterium]
MTPRERRTLTVGAFVLVLIIVTTRMLPPLVSGMVGMQREVAARRDLLTRLQAQVAAGTTLTDSASALRSKLRTLAPAILVGHNGAEALEDLNARMGVLARHGGARVQRAVPMADSLKAGVLHRVSLRLGLECDLRALVAVLRMMDQDTTAIATDALRIAATNASSPRSVPEVLNVDLVVSGWYVDALEHKDSLRAGRRGQ